MDIVNNVDEVAMQALKEDMGEKDITAALLPLNAHSVAQLTSCENAVLCGIPWFNSTFKQLDPNIDIQWQCKDGEQIVADQLLCNIAGNSQALLTGERTAMNFIQTLSATATITHEYSTILEGTTTKLLDTRKTIPGLRTAQKYAVRCGGGYNHRLGLFDAILLKENHIKIAGSITTIINLAKQRHPNMLIEIEVETLAELKQAIAAKADLIMLDNFSLADIRTAVLLTHGRIKLEASGNIDTTNVRQTAETGVDYISVGALTKHIKAIDLSMRFS